MIKKLSSFTLYPFILFLVSSTQLYFRNYNLFPLSDVLFSLIVVLSATCTLFFLIKHLLKDGVLTGLFFIFIWAILLKPISYVLLPLTLIVMYLRYNLKLEITFFLNVLALSFGLHGAIHMALIEYERLVAPPPPSNALAISNTTQLKGINPSIIHIVLDGYAGFAPLKQYMGYDNQPFKNELEQLDFTVLDTITPYNRTLYSMAAMFQGDYLRKEALIEIDDLQKYERMLADTVTKGSVAQSLVNQGYHLYFSPLGYFYTYPQGSTLIQKNIQYFLYGYLTTGTWFEPLKQLIYSPLTYFKQFVDNSFSLDFAKLPIKTPAYMLLHILSPHPPFNVDEDGNINETYEANQGFFFDGDSRHHGSAKGQLKYRNGYITKVKYTNKSVIKLIKNIQRNVKGPKIILIHGDHGSKMMHFQDIASASCIHEYFSSFLAIYSDVKGIKSTLSSQNPFSLVNAYRGIFNILFDQSYTLKTVKSFFIPKHRSLDSTPYEEIDLSTQYNNCLSWQKRLHKPIA